MKFKLLIIIFLAELILIFTSQYTFAAFDINNIFSNSNNFINGAKAQEGNSTFSKDLKDYIGLDTNSGIMGLVATIGNLIFGIVAALLGVKYIFSGIEGKSVIKETLPTFLVGVVFFYLASNLMTLLTSATDGSQGIIYTLFGGSSDFSTVTGVVWATFTLVVNVAAISGIVFIGLKYMFASAEGKANLKQTLLPAVIGIVFVYCTFNVITFIVNASSEVITGS